MPSREAFMEELQAFIAQAPKEIPLAIECRNGPWLDETWYGFLNSAGAAPVLSEKQFLPPVADLALVNRDHFGPTIVVRLLGDDRQAIEARTQNRWNEIIDPKPQLPRIAAMLRDLASSGAYPSGRSVLVNVNNHYEGSAPRSIERLKGFLLDD
jgi:uncharacterized protein YecE (DUF72 family)